MKTFLPSFSPLAFFRSLQTGHTLSLSTGLSAILVYLAVAFISTGTNLTAQPLEESFNTPLEGIPENWTRYKRNSSVPDSVAHITSHAGNNWLTFHRQTSGSSNEQAAVFYTGTTPSDSFSDGSGTLTVRLGDYSQGSSGTNIGVVVRSQNKGYNTTQGYYLAIHNGTTLGIYHNPVNHQDLGVELGSSELIGLSTETDYQFHFSFIGSTLSATVTSMDQSATLATISVDTTNFPALTEYTEGHFAIRAGFPSTDRTAYARDLSFTQIPEPGTAAVILLGVIALLTFMHKRNSGRS